MKNLNEIHLLDIVDNLKHTHCKLNLDFLTKLLINSSESNKPWKDKKFLKVISCPINKDKKYSTTIYGWIKGYRTVPFSKLIKIVELSDFSWKDIENNLISIKAGIRNGEVYPNFPIKINTELGSIIGHILGDGSIERRFHTLFYSNSKQELLKEFRDNMKVIFEIEPRIWVQEKTKFHEKSKWLKKVETLNNIDNGNCVGLFYPKICSDILYAIVGKFAEGKSKKITLEIKNFNIDFKKGLIRAFFDDEGSVRSDNHTIRFHQDNKDLLEQIKYLIIELGIIPHDVKYYITRGKQRYYFNINGFREYVKYFNIIGCTSIKKKEELEKLIKKVKNSKYFKKKFAL
jgi:hypothetical protein